jgi:O-antigen/teichoic acid export membrane protein
VGILVSRTLGLQLLTAGVTLVLARLLSPTDYGLFAIAAAAQALAQAASGIGLSAALIRQPDNPSREQQRAVSGFLLATGAGFAAAGAALAFVGLPALGLESESLEVVAVAALAVPVYAYRAVPMVLLERHLSFGRVALVETAETLTFNAFALVAALAGLGAYSLAGAIPAAALAGTITARAIKGAAPGFSLDLRQIRPLARFGSRASVLRTATLARGLGFVTLLTVIGGESMAGFYAMATRLFGFPTALAAAVQRVSFPALARSAVERPRRAARTAVLAALLASLPLAAVAGASQAIVTVLLGDRWSPTVDIVLIGSAGMLLAASVAPAMVSLALSQERAETPIVAVAASALVMGVTLAAGLTPLGSAAVGIALSAGTIAAVAVLSLDAERAMRASLVPVGRALAIGALAAAAGYLAPLPETWLGLIGRLGLVATVWACLATWLARADLRAAMRIARPMFRPARTAPSRRAQGESA